MPVQPRSSFQLAVRSQFASNSAAWRQLTALQIAAWTSLGLQIIRSDSLGQRNNLSGSQAYNSINGVLTSYQQSTVSDAPLITTPSDVATAVLTADSVTPTLSITTTGEPGTGFIGIYAAPPQTAGRSFIQNYRLIQTHAVGGSPYNILAAYTARFGTIIAGQKIAVLVRTMQDGFESIGVPSVAVAS